MTRLLQNWTTGHASRRPEDRAVIFGDESLSYGLLEQRSNQLARLLKECGCQRGDRVALLMPKSPKAITAMLATLKADCAHSPIDALNPAARVMKMLDALEPRCILAAPPAGPLLHELLNSRTAVPVGWLDEGSYDGPPTFSWQHVLAAPAAALSSRNRSEDLAHILFTSGSTGVSQGRDDHPRERHSSRGLGGPALRPRTRRPALGPFSAALRPFHVRYLRGIRRRRRTPSRAP